MDVTKAQAEKRKRAAKRAFDIVELARRLEIGAEDAECLYERAGADIVRAAHLAREEGLVSSTVDPPISATGRSAGKAKA